MPSASDTIQVFQERMARIKDIKLKHGLLNAMKRARRGQEGTSTHTTAPSLDSLPMDILFLIADHCEQQARLRLCVASRILREASTPYIYRQIDLSTHIGGLLPDPPSKLKALKLFEDEIRSELPNNLCTRQERLTETLSAQPFAHYVRTLAWTFLPTQHRGQRTAIARLWAHRRPSQDSFENFCKVARKTKSLQTLKMNDLSGEDRNLDPDRIVLPQMRLVTELELGGHFVKPLNSVWLGTLDLVNLTSLTLENPVFQPKALTALHAGIQQVWGHLASRDSLRSVFEEIHRKSPTPWLEKCRSLKQLNIRICGERYFNEFFHFSALVMAERLFMIRQLILNNRKTLQYLRYEHGPRSKRKNTWTRPIRAMDSFFGSIIYDDIIGTTWPCLRELCLQGVCSWQEPGPAAGYVKTELQPMNPLAPEILYKIREAIGPAAKLVVKY